MNSSLEVEGLGVEWTENKRKSFLIKIWKKQINSASIQLNFDTNKPCFFNNHLTYDDNF